VGTVISTPTTAYSSFSRAELDREYSPSSLAADAAGELARWARLSEEARAGLPWTEIRYGPGPDDRLDFFPAATAGRPLVIFVHGGYWIELSKRESAFLAPGFLAADVAYAALGYPLAPSATLDDIVETCERAVMHLLQRSTGLGFDGGKVHLLGHSAGAHLSAMVATGRLADLMAGLITVSGVYDLEPIRLSYVNGPLGLDARTAMRNSPLYRVRPSLAPLVIGYAERDTAEFRRQSESLRARWASAGNSVVSADVPARDHFSIIYDCADPATSLGRAVFAQIGVPS
jgi:arylformamidase